MTLPENVDLLVPAGFELVPDDVPTAVDTVERQVSQTIDGQVPPLGSWVLGLYELETHTFHGTDPHTGEEDATWQGHRWFVMWVSSAGSLIGTLSLGAWLRFLPDGSYESFTALEMDEQEAPPPAGEAEPPTEPEPVDPLDEDTIQSTETVQPTGPTDDLGLPFWLFLLGLYAAHEAER